MYLFSPKHFRSYLPLVFSLSSSLSPSLLASLAPPLSHTCVIMNVNMIKIYVSFPLLRFLFPHFLLLLPLPTSLFSPSIPQFRFSSLPLLFTLPIPSPSPSLHPPHFHPPFLYVRIYESLHLYVHVFLHTQNIRTQMKSLSFSSICCRGAIIRRQLRKTDPFKPIEFARKAQEQFIETNAAIQK